ncbi:LpxI family protein [Pseudochelatococcus lubricantis]|uniref:LpxI family protein n=1 Tax=Pseudochelatococcus lubricantis TaxID=1538102 RepID=UPI0035E9A84D
MTGSARPIAILAGGGALPGALADALGKRGEDIRILAFRGFVDGSLRRRADAATDLLDVKRTLATLAAWHPACVVLAGPVNRPQPSAVLSALAAYRNRRELAALMALGDDGLLGGVVRLLEEHGHRVEGVDSVAPELLGTAGLRSRVQPDAANLRSIGIGLDLLRTVSRFDAGQAAVIGGRRVIALEGPEGTDAMLRRVRFMRFTRRWKAENRGVLVKTTKEGQDFRVDLPAIGPRTMVLAAKAGLDGVAYGAGRTLVINEADMLREADRRGLFVIGIPPDEAGAAHDGQSGE